MFCASVSFILLTNLSVSAIPTALVPNIERIDNYTSNIVISKDGTITVTETIAVTTPNNATIRRGIFRDYPLNYMDGWLRSNRYLNVLQVLRDGQPEDYHTESLSNGIRYYFGKSDVFLDPGSYTYTFKYKIDRMLGFFEDHDELYYNITGNGWDYPIYNTKAEIELPTGITTDQITVDFYTGAQGEKGQAATKSIATKGDHQVVTVTTTETLQSGEGLTVAVAWPKAIVPEPSAVEETFWILLDNFPIFLGLFIFPLIVIYSFVLWFLKGRDPRQGTIIPLFNPPDNISPGAMRYIDKMGIDDKGITAAVINLAIKKRLTISEDKSGIFNATEYSLIKRSNDYTNLPAEELAYFERLFSQSKPIDEKVKLSSTHYTKFQSAKSNFQNSLEASYKGSHIQNSGWWLLPAYLIVSGYFVILFIFYASGTGNDAEALLLFALIWNTIVAFFIPPMFKSIFMNGNNDGLVLVGKIFAGCFIFPFILVGCATIIFAVQANPLSLIVLTSIIGSSLALITASIFMPKRTVKGRKLEDKILGFKMFLNTTERFRIAELIPHLPLDLGNKKQNISEDVVRLKLFELYLPYAIALDIEKKWSAQFAEVLARNQDLSTGYGNWYSGSHAFSSAAFASSLSSGLSGAVSSSATAPGSSSGGGGGGGGSSGGGGGGGGGGGW